MSEGNLKRYSDGQNSLTFDGAALFRFFYYDNADELKMSIRPHNSQTTRISRQDEESIFLSDKELKTIATYCSLNNITPYELKD